MIVKAMTAGVVAALMTGGAVYFGMGPEGLTPSADRPVKAGVNSPAAVDDDAPLGSEKEKAAEPEAERNIEIPADEVEAPSDEVEALADIDPAKPRPPAPEIKVAEAAVERPSSSRQQWLDRYLERGRSGREQAAEPQAGEDTQTQDTARGVLAEQRPADAAQIQDTSDQTAASAAIGEGGGLDDVAAPPITIPAPPLPDDPALSAPNSLALDSSVQVSQNSLLPDPPLPPGSMRDVGQPAERVVEPVRVADTGIALRPAVQIDSVPSSEPGGIDEDLVDISNTPDKIDNRIALIMREIGAIAQPDQRDMAYLDVVNYALSANKYGAARQALTMIGSPELREPALIDLAVRYAKAGDADTAFDMARDIQTLENSDALRLRVIEALISADSTQ